jgi:hypothetical protein
MLMFRTNLLTFINSLSFFISSLVLAENGNKEWRPEAIKFELKEVTKMKHILKYQLHQFVQVKEISWHIPYIRHCLRIVRINPDQCDYLFS